MSSSAARHPLRPVNVPVPVHEKRARTLPALATHFRARANVYGHGHGHVYGGLGVGRVAVLVLLVLCVMCTHVPRAHAQPGAPHRALEGTMPSIRQRIDTLGAWLDRVAARGDKTINTRYFNPDSGRFCGIFADFDMQRTTFAMWADFSKVPMRQLIPLLARYVRGCDLSGGAAKRAGYLLDLLYWNRLEDLTGEDPARFTMVRDGFYELHIARLTEAALQRAALYTLAPPPPGAALQGDFLDANPMRRVTLLRAVPDVVSAFSPDERRSFSRMVELVDFREGHLTPFGSSLTAMLDSPDDLQFLQNAYDWMLEVRARPELLRERHGGWHALMRMTNGDAVTVSRVFGVLGALLYLPLQELAPALAARGKLSEPFARAMYQGAMAYYLANEIDELSARIDEHGERVYHYMYPDGYETRNWKQYHFFGNAYLGCDAARLGLPDAAIAGAARVLGAAYEGVTLSLVIVARHTLDVEPRAAAIVEAGEDVRINGEGALYGARICRKPPPRSANSDPHPHPPFSLRSAPVRP